MDRSSIRHQHRLTNSRKGKDEALFNAVEIEEVSTEEEYPQFLQHLPEDKRLSFTPLKSDFDFGINLIIGNNCIMATRVLESRDLLPMHPIVFEKTPLFWTARGRITSEQKKALESSNRLHPSPRRSRRSPENSIFITGVNLEQEENALNHRQNLQFEWSNPSSSAVARRAFKIACKEITDWDAALNPDGEALNTWKIWLKGIPTQWEIQIPRMIRCSSKDHLIQLEFHLFFACKSLSLVSAILYQHYFDGNCNSERRFGSNASTPNSTRIPSSQGLTFRPDKIEARCNLVSYLVEESHSNGGDRLSPSHTKRPNLRRNHRCCLQCFKDSSTQPTYFENLQR